MNIIALTGNATKDIELKYTPGGTAVGTGTIAVRRDFKNQQGEYETDFVNFLTFGKQAEIMANYIHKGDKFGLTGRLQIRKWEKDGKTNYFTEVVVSGFDFPNKKDNASNVNKFTESVNNSEPPSDPFASGGTLDISDDDMPF